MGVELYFVLPVNELLDYWYMLFFEYIPLYYYYDPSLLLVLDMNELSLFCFFLFMFFQVTKLI